MDLTELHRKLDARRSRNRERVDIEAEIPPPRVTFNCNTDGGIEYQQEENKMGEGQSRYGIMEELNNRKVAQKEKLSNIEKDTDSKVYESEKELTKAKENIIEKEKTYKQVHKDKERELNLRLSLMESDLKRRIEELSEEIKGEQETFEPKFQDWKKEQNRIIKLGESELARYKTVQAKKISEKKEIIKEVEEGIKNLKEMSAEQKEK